MDLRVTNCSAIVTCGGLYVKYETNHTYHFVASLESKTAHS